MLFFVSFFKFFKIYLFWETVRVGEGQRERIQSRLWPASAEPDMGLELTRPWDHDLSLNQELDAQPTEAPKYPSKLNVLIKNLETMIVS